MIRNDAPSTSATTGTIRRPRLRRLIPTLQPPRRLPHRVLPLGGLGAVVGIILLEAVVWLLRLDVTPTVTYAWVLSGQAAVSEATRASVLIFGDSLNKHGVQPLLLERRLGRNAYNLAVPAAPASASYFLLRRCLMSGAQPEAILVDFAPDILAGGPKESARNWAEFLTVREWAEINWEEVDAGFLARTTIERVIPSSRARFEIRSIVLAAFAGRSASQREQSLDHAFHWTRNRGGHLAAKNPAFTGLVSEEEQQRLMSKGFRSHRVNTNYIERFLTLAAERGIPVYWILPPVSPALQERRWATGADDGYTRLIRSFVERFSHLTVLDARESGYKADVFVDARHLDRNGAASLTEDIAMILERRRAGVPCSSWIKLPAYRPVIDANDLEDIHQSILARRQNRVR